MLLWEAYLAMPMSTIRGTGLNVIKEGVGLGYGFFRIRTCWPSAGLASNASSLLAERCRP